MGWVSHFREQHNYTVPEFSRINYAALRTIAELAESGLKNNINLIFGSEPNYKTI